MDEQSIKYASHRLTEDRDYETERLTDSVLQDRYKPQDKGYVIRLIFFILGIGVLTAFNVMINCLDFYG